MSLENVKVGDPLIRYCHPFKTVVKVERITATQIICGSSKYNKKTGFIIGGSAWSRAHVCVPRDGEAEAVIEAEEIYKMRRNIENMASSKSISNEKIRAMHAILMENPNEP